MTLAGVNEATYYLSMLHKHNEAMAEARKCRQSRPRKPEERRGSIYAVRLIKNGTEKSIMFYGSHQRRSAPPANSTGTRKASSPPG